MAWSREHIPHGQAEMIEDDEENGGQRSIF